MLGLGRRLRRIGRDVMGALVVRDQYGTARDIGVVGVQKPDTARAEACQEQERDAGVPDPRLTAKHQIQLSDTRCTASSTGLSPQKQCPRMHARDERVRTLYSLSVNMKQHGLTRSNRHLAEAVRSDTALAIDSLKEERRNAQRVP
jgi:hypothetical protein